MEKRRREKNKGTWKIKKSKKARWTEKQKSYIERFADGEEL